MSTKLAKLEPVWVDRNGVGIPVSGMSSNHLLSAIHMVERNRFNAIVEIKQNEINIDERNFEYYTDFSEIYQALVKEAKKRKLIGR